MQLTQTRKKPAAQLAVLSVQSGLTLLLGLGLVASGIRHINKLAQPTQGHRILIAALIAGIIGAATLTSVVGIAKSKRWGRTLGIVSEAVFVLLGIASLGRSPIPAAIAIVFAGVALFVLGRTGSAWDSPDEDQSNRWDFQAASAAAAPTPQVSQCDDVSTAPERKSDSASVILAVVTAGLLIGALVIRSRVIFGLIALAAIFIPMERLLSLHPQKIFRKNFYTDIVHFAVNNLFTTIGVVLMAAAILFGLKQAIPVGFQHAVHGQPFWLQFIEAVLISDLAGYASHRASHEVPFLWKFHAVHHSISEMDWLASARLHPLDQAFRQSCIIIPLYVMGFTKATFGAYLVLTGFLALFQHSNVKLRYGPLRWVLMNPQAHHWHHANEPEHYNKNFAGAFPFIDVIFGTAYIPAKQWPGRYGIDNPTPPGYLRQMAWPFRWKKWSGVAATQAG